MRESVGIRYSLSLKLVVFVLVLRGVDVSSISCINSLGPLSVFFSYIAAIGVLTSNSGGTSLWVATLRRVLWYHVWVPWLVTSLGALFG